MKADTAQIEKALIAVNCSEYPNNFAHDYDIFIRKWQKYAWQMKEKLIQKKLICIHIDAVGRVPSKKIEYWANVCFNEHAIAQPCWHATIEKRFKQ